MEISKTERGFSIGKFYDRTNELCSIQESSIATEPCIWLGCNVGQRMHLTIDNVKDLLPLLQRFVDTGYIDINLPEDQTEIDRRLKERNTVTNHNSKYPITPDEAYEKKQTSPQTKKENQITPKHSA